MKHVGEFRRKFSILLLSVVLLSAYSAAKAASSYALSGSPDGTASILVDDDLDVYLNGILIYTDGTNSAGNRPPINFSADGGNSIHIVVRDTYGDCSSLSPVYLTRAGGQAIVADPGFNLGCGRPTTDLGVVHDITLIVPELTSQFQAWGGGNFGDGQPNPPYPGQLLPLPIYLPPNISDIEQSGDTAFLTTDGNVLVSGYNNYGELGQGYFTAPYPAPNSFYPTPLMVPGLSNVKQIVGGSDGGSSAFFVALLADGTVRSWGYNAVGELGNGVITTLATNTCKCVPTVQTVLGLSGVTSVSAGYGHVLALKADGTVWAWGNNYQGELGDGTFSDGRPVALQVAGLPNIVAIAAGASHNLALASDGTLWAWGSNAYGELGNGTIDPPGIEGIPTPIQVPISGVAAIAAGDNLSFAIKIDGTVWAWGEDFAGQTGTGGTGGLIGGKSTYLASPTQALISNVASIKTKRYNVIARKTDGTVWTWGYGNSGLIGNGTLNQVNSTPSQVPIPPRVGGLIDIGYVAAFAYAPTNTATGSNVSVQSIARDARATFSQVTGVGNTTFTAINPSTAGTVPSGYTLCPNCPAYDISTTAAYTPPVTVCIDVPAAVDAAAFDALALLHGENGVLVDVTTSHVINPDGTREVCGQVSSLSPFVLAQYAAPTPTPTPTPPTAPSAPSNLAVTAVLSGEIDLAWVDNSNNESNFELERCDGKGKCRMFVLVASPGQNVISYRDVGLLPATSYAYRVRAVNLVGNSAYSNTAKAKTPRR